MRMRAALAIVVLASAATAQDAKAPRVCLVSGSREYESEKTLPILQKRLEARGAVCSRAFLDGKDETRLPGLKHLADADVMVLFTRRLKLGGEDLDAFKNYCLAGKPIVGIRTASHAVQTWLDLDKEVLGGNYTGHYGKGPTHVSIVDSAKAHPILQGFAPFASEGTLYKNAGIAKDAQVLLTGKDANATMPVAWTRTYRGARIFYTSLGHQKDFENDGFVRMLENATFWAATRP